MMQQRITKFGRIADARILFDFYKTFQYVSGDPNIPY